MLTRRESGGMCVMAVGKLLMVMMVLGAVSLQAAPERSMIGAKMSIFEKEEPESYTAADYIQDGLVAMWDGIENAGWKEHDSTAAEWVDLTGLTGNLRITAAGTWENFCLKQVSIAYAAAVSPFGVAYQLGDIQTIECLFSNWQESASGYDFFSLGTKNSGKRYGNYCARGGIVAGNSLENFQDGIPITLLSRNLIHGISFTYAASGTNYAPLHGFLDGVEIPLQHTPNNMYGKDGGTGFITVGGASGTSSYMACPSNTRYYCIRLYNRALSAEEISYNYLVDKERFGL